MTLATPSRPAAAPGTGLPVVVVGAGLAGLACARALAAAGRRVRLLERGDGPGGRVRTDVVDGFRLDRGFQVLLTAYPEARIQLDYVALDLRRFYPGALVRAEGRFHRVADPFRQPLDALRSLGNPVGSLRDKLRVLSLRSRALEGTLAQLWRRPATTALQELVRQGFSPRMIERFFRPFLGGIFLSRDLDTSSRMLDFVMRMMAEGDTAVPARGMGAISEQLAATLPAGTLRLGAEVTAVAPDGVTLAGGERLPAAAVVVATGGDVAARLLGLPAPPPPRSTATLWFAASASPVGAPILVLDGEGDGPVNNLAVLSDVAPAYAPPGQALVAASVPGMPAADDAELERQVRAQLVRWYGPAATWRLLRVDRIRWAQPAQSPADLEPVAKPARLAPGLFIAGDHRDTASIHGALASGRRAAEAALADLAATP